MIIILAILVPIILLSLVAWLDRQTSPADSREPYYRDSAGRVLALAVGEGVSHEDFIHDGTPHQNPAVREETRWLWYFFPYTVQVSYYPITINGRWLPDIDALQEQVEAARRKGIDVELVALSPQLEREVIRRENGTQLDRDVPAGRLQYKLSGKRRR